MGILPVVQMWSRFQVCQACGYRTAMTQTTLLQPPTTFTTGYRERSTECFFCLAQFTDWDPGCAWEGDWGETSKNILYAVVWVTCKGWLHICPGFQDILPMLPQSVGSSSGDGFGGGSSSGGGSGDDF